MHRFADNEMTSSWKSVYLSRRHLACLRTCSQSLLFDSSAGERLAQVVRFIRVLILVLLLAGVMRLTGRLEQTSMPLMGIWARLETLVTVVLGLREQRQFADLTLLQGSFVALDNNVSHSRMI